MSAHPCPSGEVDFALPDGRPWLHAVRADLHKRESPHGLHPEAVQTTKRQLAQGIYLASASEPCLAALTFATSCPSSSASSDPREGALPKTSKTGV